MVITFSNKKCGVVYALQSLTSVVSSHLVNYSVTVMIYLARDLLASGWIGPLKSISHFSNTYKVVVLGASHPFWWVFQPFDRHHISRNIPWHLYELLATIILHIIPSVW
jgi:hypothetical protein